MEGIFRNMKEHPIISTIVFVYILAALYRWGPPATDATTYLPYSVGGPLSTVFNLALTPFDYFSGSSLSSIMPSSLPSFGGVSLPGLPSTSGQSPQIQSAPAQNYSSAAVCAPARATGCTYTFQRGDSVNRLYRQHPNWSGTLPYYNGEACFDQSNIRAGDTVNVPCGN